MKIGQNSITKHVKTRARCNKVQVVNDLIKHFMLHGLLNIFWNIGRSLGEDLETSDVQYLHRHVVRGVAMVTREH